MQMIPFLLARSSARGSGRSTGKAGSTLSSASVGSVVDRDGDIATGLSSLFAWRDESIAKP